MEATYAACLDIAEDRWLANVVGYPVYRVTPRDAGNDEPDILDRAATELTAHCREQRRAFYYAKIETARVRLLHALIRAGMFVVDVNLLLDMPLRVATRCLATHSGASDVRVVDAEIRHTQQLLEIAGSSFQYSRMHLDPDIPDTTADQVRLAWLRSYLDGQRGDRLLVAEQGGRVSGFLAAMVSSTGCRRLAVLDLMAVAPQAQRQGVGRVLVHHWADHYAPRCDTLRVGTQAANIPALRLYESCGFLAAGSSYVLHLHVE